MGDANQTHVRKFVLVPAEALARIANPMPDVHRTYADAAQRNMQSVLERGHIPADIRKVLYTQELIDYLTQKKILEQPVRLSIEEEERLLQLPRQRHNAAGDADENVDDDDEDGDIYETPHRRDRRGQRRLRFDDLDRGAGPSGWVPPTPSSGTASPFPPRAAEDAAVPGRHRDRR